jgi:hypothetical protein
MNYFTPKQYLNCHLQALELNFKSAKNLIKPDTSKEKIYTKEQILAHHQLNTHLDTKLHEPEEETPGAVWIWLGHDLLIEEKYQNLKVLVKAVQNSHKSIQELKAANFEIQEKPAVGMIRSWSITALKTAEKNHKSIIDLISYQIRLFKT